MVIDRQFPATISTRKLVIETAGMNVITAYSAGEAVQTLARFPNVTAAVLDTEAQGMTCIELIGALRRLRPDLQIVTVSPSGHDPCGPEEYHLSGYDPQKLLETLRELTGTGQRGPAPTKG